MKSELGRGTTFTALFPPSSKQEPVTVRPGPREHRWRSQGTFLVVDDEKYVRIIAKTVLEEAGFTVLTANDGREGLELFRQRAEEIVGVLLDMTMPMMGGDEVYREIRKTRSDVPVILSSGYNEEEIVQQMKEKGRAGFIQKPYQPQALIDKVREVFEQ